MQIRTDLIAEEYAAYPSGVLGAQMTEISFGNIVSQQVKIQTESASAQLKRPCGTYITVRFEPLTLPSDTEQLTRAVIDALARLFPKSFGAVLVVGLGNREITPDAIGPQIADRVLATRHIGADLARKIRPLQFRSVAVLAPGVLGQTGMEAVEIVRGAVARIHPDAVLVVDALAAKDADRLCATVQLCDTGIHPGSGVQNTRREFSAATLGVPVIAVGVPTVVDVGALVGTCENMPEKLRQMMVTPREIDFAVRRSAEILSRAINLFLQPDLDAKTLAELV